MEAIGWALAFLFLLLAWAGVLDAIADRIRYGILPPPKDEEEVDK